jgi:methylenetetrahydrofolate reductase (NADPH)
MRRQGTVKYEPRADGFAYAADLVAGLKTVGDFEISVAAYPEKHPEAASPEFDLDVLKRKIDAGATRAITQFFYDTDLFLRFRDACAATGITAPIVPGILPITRFPQITRFAKRCGASIPEWLEQRFDGLEDNAETRKLISAAVAIGPGAHAAASRRGSVPLLHAQSLRAHLRHLPRTRRAAEERRPQGGE